MNVAHNPEKKCFEIFNDENTKMGLIEYMNGGNNEIYATHTEVFPEFEGQGLARHLLDAMVAWAEQENLKIVPVCGYVIGAFKKYPEKYAAVIK